MNNSVFVLYYCYTKQGIYKTKLFTDINSVKDFVNDKNLYDYHCYRFFPHWTLEVEL